MRMQIAFALTIAVCTVFNGTVAAQNIDQGQWINLFDQETSFGWTNIGDATWEVKDGVLTSTGGTGGMLATTSQFSNFELTAKIKISSGGSTGLVFRSGIAGHPTENGSSVVWISKRKNEKSEWQEIRILTLNDKLSVTIDGKDAGRDAHLGDNSKGYIGILYHHNGAPKVEVSEVKLRPIGLRAIFNGKNLDGWEAIPDKASKFSVIDGAINIEDGNGQIETKEVFKDFVLQLDIISNGTHLNSGVFFRSPPGVFWKGYESQVRNQWSGDNRSKPIDYGTGGNYGNQSARKVVSTDGEWFSKTIVADGNHSSVWINGYQVSDFTDTRPVNRGSNAKEGYVGEAGTINLQGHDPTTNLSFKNINIQKN